MKSIPKKIEEVLLSYVKRTYLPAGRGNPKYAHLFTAHDINFFARGVAEMSSYFTSERGSLPKNYLNKKELLAGYILYFVMANMPKVSYCLEEAGAAQLFGNKETIKILDMGSGPGTASISSAHYFGQRLPKTRLAISALDQNTKALHDAKHIFQQMQFANASLKTIYSFLHTKNIARSLQNEKYDVIICANSLSEAGGVETQALIVEELLASHLSPDGIFIVIEPALRHTTRNLMQLHDLLLEHEISHHFIAPCTHSLSCPMLRHNHRDWCHVYIDWARPEVVAKIDQLVGNRKDYLKFSYFILSMSKIATEHVSPEVFRAVSAPMRSKGKIEVLLCNKGGLIRVTRQDKNASPSNADFDCIQRGQLVIWNGALTIEKDSLFKILTPRVIV